MPEGDTVHRTARLLHAGLASHLLTKTDLRVPEFATVDLRGQTLDEVVARGKHLLMRTDGGITIHSHLGMDGVWRLAPLSASLPRPIFQIRVLLETASCRAVGSRLRALDVLRRADEDSIVGHLGPDLLGEDWDLSEATRRMQSRPDATVSDALLDQSVVAGFGNVYRNELCFLRGYDPWRLVQDCDVPATLALGKRVMETNREHAGHVTTGDPRPGRSRYVYGRGGLPCRRCGTLIRKATERSERVTYWCPRCQPPT